VHLVFQAESPEAVAEFHRAGLAAGGIDNGAPGSLLDPDSNGIEAVFHGPAQRSSRAVVISFP